MKPSEARGQRFEPMSEGKQLAWCRRMVAASGLPLGVVVALFQEGRQQQLARMPAKATRIDVDEMEEAEATQGNPVQQSEPEPF